MAEGLIAADPPRPPAGVADPGCPAITILKRRADFLRAASARRQGTAGFLLQARQRREGEPVADGTIRVGFTCSKKLGNAVARNRAKRRLRALAREILPGGARPGWDYVLVGRPEATASREFALLRGDLLSALQRVHAATEQPARAETGPAPRRRDGR